MIAIGPATPMFSKSQIQVYSPSGEGLLLFSVHTPSAFTLLKLIFVLNHSGIKPGLFVLAGQVMSD